MDLNDWFLNLPPERQAILREDRWMLARAAWEAATQIAHLECAKKLAQLSSKQQTPKDIPE